MSDQEFKELFITTKILMIKYLKLIYKDFKKEDYHKEFEKHHERLDDIESEGREAYDKLLKLKKNYEISIATFN